MQAYRHNQSVLENGLTVVTIAMPHLHSAYISLYARVGSRHETLENNGLSHFLEHMFFRGCEGFHDSTQLNAAMEDLGGVLDGFTARDFSSYHANVHPDFVTDALRILGSMFLASTFADLEIERSIVVEEMLDAIDDRGRMIDLDSIAHREMFEGHPLAFPIEGSLKNVRRFDFESLQAHRRKFYGAKNLVLCVAGRIESKSCKNAIRKAFGPLKHGKRIKESPPPTRAGSSKLIYVRTDETQTRIRLSFRCVPEGHDDHPALVLLRQVLDGGLSGRLQTELVERQGLAYDVGADLESYSDCGILSFELAVANKKMPHAVEQLGRFILDMRRRAVPTQELDRVRRRTRLSLELALDSPAELSHCYGETALFRTPISFKEKMRKLVGLSSDDLLRITRKYLSHDRLISTAVGGADPTVLRKARTGFKRFIGELSCPAHP
jgi:predicted Zn-dependent peptidase